jgi:transposase
MPKSKLQLLIKRLLRQQFGRRSEQLSADQWQLALEDLEQTVAANEAAQDAAADNQRQRTRDTPHSQPRRPPIASAAL